MGFGQCGNFFINEYCLVKGPWIVFAWYLLDDLFDQLSSFNLKLNRYLL